MHTTPPPVPPDFDAEPWLWAHDETQHKMFALQNWLTLKYVQMKQDRKQGIFLSAAELENIIEVSEEATTLSRELLGGTVNSLRVAHCKVMQALSIDIELMQGNLEVANSIAITLCEQRLSATNKNNIK